MDTGRLQGRTILEPALGRACASNHGPYRAVERQAQLERTMWQEDKGRGPSSRSSNSRYLYRRGRPEAQIHDGSVNSCDYHSSLLLGGWLQNPPERAAACSRSSTDARVRSPASTGAEYREWCKANLSESDCVLTFSSGNVLRLKAYDRPKYYRRGRFDRLADFRSCLGHVLEPYSAYC